jgi:DNA-binding transcriptional ArsR family regulator
MPSISENPDRAQHVADIVKAIAHPVRLRIVAIIATEDQRVGSLVERLGTTQANVSQHLRILRMSGLVTTVRKNGAARYTLAEPGLKDLINCLEGCAH